MDYIATAETLETLAASLRREHARLELGGDPQLPLAPPVDDGWRPGQEEESEQPADNNEWHDWNGGAVPPEAYGKNVDVVYREGIRPGDTAPAAVLDWRHNGGDPTDIVEWRISADQPVE